MHLFGMYLNEPAFIKNDFLSDLRTLAENISDDFICNLDKIVALNLKQNKMFKQSLVLHLLPTVYRLKYGFNLYNPLLGEIKTNYAGSFSLATMINSSFWNICCFTYFCSSRTANGKTTSCDSLYNGRWSF